MTLPGPPVEVTKLLPPPAIRRRRLPLACNVVAEVLSQCADACLHPMIVLPLFFAVYLPTEREVGGAVALVLAAAAIAAGLGAVLTFEEHPRVRFGALLGATGGRALVLLLLAAASGRLTSDHIPRLNWPLYFLAAAALCAGFALPLRVASAGIVRAEGSWRTRWGRWAATGAVGLALGAVLARGQLARIGGVFPVGYRGLFLIAAVIALVATAVTALLWLGDLPTAPVRPRAGLAAIPELLTNNLAYGRFIFFRLLYACGALADPFFILYAVSELNASARVLVGYLLALALARMVGTFLWRGVSSTGGNPMVLQLVSFVRLLAPITALTLPPLLNSATLHDHLPGGNNAVVVAFGLVFVAWGIASAGLDLAVPAIQSGITTPRERAAASVVTGIALAVATVILPVGGLIADRFGYSFLFIAALVTGVIALLAGGLIDEPTTVIVRAAPTDHLPYRRNRVHREG
ncbi:MAG: hypothetical protein ACTHMJ_01570 [Thermomicrobiales bacterium]